MIDTMLKIVTVICQEQYYIKKACEYFIYLYF